MRYMCRRRDPPERGFQERVPGERDPGRVQGVRDPLPQRRRQATAREVPRACL